MICFFCTEGYIWVGTFSCLNQPALVTATYRILGYDSHLVPPAEFVFLHSYSTVFTFKVSPGRHIEWMNAKRLPFKGVFMIV